ncbi:T9SS type A sorting domain-containing protein [Rhodonellum sp.]|uniref:T9SS type A sorting domain-containing protein n=1 Tax=Rhodonellum sp. TaxID=2231180 RepID=UPI0027218ABD|nr:T9SS type A sorting domain-containing protein [Rhodonellum sp.]MDO9553745.1 T9SS type A sorting domain-containing protein [Rhodonellum sp.]
MGYGKVNAFKALQEAFPITGPSLICSSGTYTLLNQPAGTNITWISSNPNGLNINPTTGAASRLNNFNGEITITATINAACGPTSLTRNIWVGNPGAGINTLLWTGTRGVNPVSTNPGATYIFNVDQVPNATSYTWVLPSGFSVYGGSTTTTSTSIYITTSMTIGTYTLYCRANNACGSSWTNSLTINNSGSGGGGPVPLVVYPNPASSSLIIQDESKGSEGFSESSVGNPEYVEEFEIQLLDNNGRIRKTGKSLKRRLELKIDDLPDGQYILEIRTVTKTDFRHIIIKH